jgi:hypothetical protein
MGALTACPSSSTSTCADAATGAGGAGGAAYAGGADTFIGIGAAACGEWRLMRTDSSPSVAEEFHRTQHSRIQKIHLCKNVECIIL